MRDLLDKLSAIQEGQLNEYLIRAGDSIDGILEMNLFMDLLDVDPEDCPKDYDEMRKVNSDREFEGLNYLVTQNLCAKYKPIAEKLAQEIQAQADRELTEEEAEMIEEVWYEVSDVYQDAYIDELARIYDSQIEVIEKILSGANEGVVKEAGSSSLQAAYDAVYEYVGQMDDEALEIMERMAPKFSQALDAANGDVAVVEANSSPKAIAYYMGELEEVEGNLAELSGEYNEGLNRMRSHAGIRTN